MVSTLVSNPCSSVPGVTVNEAEGAGEGKAAAPTHVGRNVAIIEQNMCHSLRKLAQHIWQLFY